MLHKLQHHIFWTRLYFLFKSMHPSALSLLVLTRLSVAYDGWPARLVTTVVCGETAPPEVLGITGGCGEERPLLSAGTNQGVSPKALMAIECWWSWLYTLCYCVCSLWWLSLLYTVLLCVQSMVVEPVVHCVIVCAVYGGWACCTLCYCVCSRWWLSLLYTVLLCVQSMVVEPVVHSLCYCVCSLWWLSLLPDCPFVGLMPCSWRIIATSSL